MANVGLGESLAIAFTSAGVERLLSFMLLLTASAITKLVLKPQLSWLPPVVTAAAIVPDP